ncbi:NAD(P)-dependent oxidoreductase [Phaeobacter sp. PT47_59]|uniref:NAD(P)-dependent oxidoreductase n=1 Tax=Phaeobacter sp. PT47_59 TaxID=3029979 RepID=UPI0023806BE7|nr:NAD(P)-dependent oxidoreductase [Phaeobacter sp. PT47_59]MDE4175413.1 NAD(P)-dependent oxidoreductase [Phaeobacter sp. PT47_59]
MLEVEAVGICLIFSAVNPNDENKVAEILRREMPGVDISISRQVNNIVREYRRARATVIDVGALPRALECGQVARTTLDVTEHESLPIGHAFYTHPSIQIAPHIAWKGRGSNNRLLGIILESLNAFARGAPLRNQIDLSRGY